MVDKPHLWSYLQSKNQYFCIAIHPIPGLMFELSPRFSMKKISFLLLLSFLALPALSLDVYDDISNAIRSGDARQIATFFGSSVELSITNQEDVYSKAQAELILRDFFSKNTPKSFSILHKGSSKEGLLYAISSLVSSTGKSFRVSFYVKNSSNKNTIQELRIEAE
jgi:hypothetical protein